MGEVHIASVSVEEAWARLKRDAGSVLIDVRTTAEWAFVGVADLASIVSITVARPLPFSLPSPQWPGPPFLVPPPPSSHPPPLLPYVLPWIAASNHVGTQARVGGGGGAGGCGCAGLGEGGMEDGEEM